MSVEELRRKINKLHSKLDPIRNLLYELDDELTKRLHNEVREIKNWLSEDMILNLSFHLMPDYTSYTLSGESSFFENRQYISHTIKDPIRKISHKDSITVTNNGKTFYIQTSNLNFLSEFIMENKVKVKLNDKFVEAMETIKDRLLRS